MKKKLNISVEKIDQVEQDIKEKLDGSESKINSRLTSLKYFYQVSKPLKSAPRGSPRDPEILMENNGHVSAFR